MSQAPPPGEAGAPLLPAGRSWPELARALRALKRDDLDWRRGRHAAFVWHADEDVERVAREAYTLFMTENGLGLRVFPSLRRMEADVVAMVRHLLGGDDATTGHLTSGGTESIFLATHAARQWARQQRPEITEPEIVAPWSAHPAVNKAAHYLGMKVLRVPVGAGFRADVAAMAAAITPRTVMLYGSAPTYSLGVIDPIAALADLARTRGLWLHVDACVGGILGPFVRALGHPVPEFGLALPGVTSVSADLHKSGYTAKGASVVLFRTALHQAAGRYDFDDWPTGLYSVNTFTGTRPGGAIAAAWAVMNFLGEAGYRRIAATVMEAKAHLVEGLARIGGGLRVWGEPELWAVGFGSADHDVFTIADRMTARGWSVGRIREPRGIHLMLTPVHAPIIDEYLADLARSVDEARAATRPSPTRAVY
ncbi:MAG TPA: aminotransferase class V-fold PLP-dependent enzyme [Candidatus Deferrimicrobiaceae bacterium]|nr:aminotransferase class V-fold PLP-dependent enzyme [Candidatus Deferrimicrobiaceae bacterium]